MFYSPLRYPWGKNKLANFFSKVCTANNINGHYIELYAGWASVALHLLMEKYVDKITINDKDKSIYAFWHCVLNETERFCEQIASIPIDITNWRTQFEIQNKKDSVWIFELGFSTFFLNRTNRSGIIKAGVIGGVTQEGTYKLDCRFNKNELIERIRNIAEYKNKITLTNLDALELIETVSSRTEDETTILYLDPPYYFHGKSLYMSHYAHRDHEEISNAIAKISNVHWIISYDAAPEIEEIYSWVPENRVIRYSLSHSAYKRREWSELLFMSENLFFHDSAENPTSIKL